VLKPPGQLITPGQEQKRGSHQTFRFSPRSAIKAQKLSTLPLNSKIRRNPISISTSEKNPRCAVKVARLYFRTSDPIGWEILLLNAHSALYELSHCTRKVQNMARCATKSEGEDSLYVNGTEEGGLLIRYQFRHSHCTKRSSDNNADTVMQNNLQRKIRLSCRITLKCNRARKQKLYQ
jgi:hypothetical protein